MYGLARGECVSVLMGLMCCLLHLNLQPGPSIIYDLGVFALLTMVPSRYEV